jgi:hypothetical protein
MASEPQGDRLPFEPTKKRQKPTKTKATPEQTVKKLEKAPASKSKEPKKPEQVKRYTKEDMSIPKVVSDRMARRMAVMSGVPTFLGIATFFISYAVTSQGWLKLPSVAVLLVSMGFFGLGVLGITYGVLSASWDEEIAGSKLGWQEFKINWRRMVSAWRETRQKNL